MEIQLAGGYIVSSGEWIEEGSKETRTFWLGYSKHIEETETFYTKGMAEFVVWVNHELHESRRVRLAA